MRYFGNKDQLFAAAADFDLALPDLSDVDREQLGARLVTHFVDRWERDEVMVVLLRSSTTNADAAQRMQAIFATQLLPVIAGINPDDPQRRAGLIATQMLGPVAVPLRPAAAARRRHVARRDRVLARAYRSALPRGTDNRRHAIVRAALSQPDWPRSRLRCTRSCSAMPTRPSTVSIAVSRVANGERIFRSRSAGVEQQRIFRSEVGAASWPCQELEALMPISAPSPKSAPGS